MSTQRLQLILLAIVYLDLWIGHASTSARRGLVMPPAYPPTIRHVTWSMAPETSTPKSCHAHKIASLLPACNVYCEGLIPMPVFGTASVVSTQGGPHQAGRSAEGLGEQAGKSLGGAPQNLNHLEY